MKERIEELMRSEGLTSVKLAELLSVQPSNISHIMSGRNNPSYDLIVKLVERFPRINPEWILLGKGDMYKCNIDNGVRAMSEQPVTNVNNNTDMPFIKQANSDMPPESNVYDTSITKNNLSEGIYSPADNISTDAQQSKLLEPKIDSSIINNLQLSEMISDSKKQVKKIILLYDDNSFEIFYNT